MSWFLDIFFCRAGCIASLALRLAGVQTCLSCPHVSGQMIRCLWLSKSCIILFGKLLFGIFRHSIVGRIDPLSNCCSRVVEWDWIRFSLRDITAHSSLYDLRLEVLWSRRVEAVLVHRANTYYHTVLWRLSVRWLLSMALTSLWKIEFVGPCLLALRSRCFSRCPTPNRLCWSCFCVLVDRLVWRSNFIHWRNSKLLGRALLKFRSVRAHSRHCGWHKRTWRVVRAMLLDSELIAGWITDTLFSRNGNGGSQVTVGTWSRFAWCLDQITDIFFPFSPCYVFFLLSFECFQSIWIQEKIALVSDFFIIFFALIMLLFMLGQSWFTSFLLQCIAASAPKPHPPFALQISMNCSDTTVL